MIEVTRKRKVYDGTTFTNRVRDRQGLVYWAIGEKVIELKTPRAHQAGFDMVRQAGEAEPSELIVVTINGEEVDFPPELAMQVGGALLRKADAADDFQQRIHS